MRFIPPLKINIPFIGDFDIKASFPNLARDICKGIDQQIASSIEFIGSLVPIFGGVINKVVGN